MREEDAKMEKITWEMSAEEAVGSSRAAFIKKIYELAKTNDKICLVNCDCSPAGSVQDKFSKDFGDRFIDTGIMEQTACGLAAGLALSGKTVFCQAFGPFLSTRAIEFVYLALITTRRSPTSARTAASPPPPARPMRRCWISRSCAPCRT